MKSAVRHTSNKPNVLIKNMKNKLISLSFAGLVLQLNWLINRFDLKLEHHQFPLTKNKHFMFTMKKFFKISFLCIGILFVLLTGYYFLIKKLDNEIMTMKMKDFYSSSYNLSQATLLPSSFIDGERFYIKMVTVNGDTLLAYGDTGGGLSLIVPSVIDSLNLESKVKTGLIKGFFPMKYIPFYSIVKDKNIPPPVPLPSVIFRRYMKKVQEPFLLVPPNSDEFKDLTFMRKSMPFDIFLGQNYFMDKSWTFDYLNKQVWVNTPLNIGEQGVQKIGFKKNSNNESIFGHPSMYIVVDGEIIEVLFDTGATLVLSDDGKKELNTTEKTMGGSFIAKSIFDKWRKEHPEWKYYEKADMGKDVIEVPKVSIGGHEVGPVLFAKRDDEVWSKGMINTMDTVVRGAIGGSALKYLKVTIDYNSDLVKFSE